MGWIWEVIIIFPFIPTLRYQHEEKAIEKAEGRLEEGPERTAEVEEAAWI